MSGDFLSDHPDPRVELGALNAANEVVALIGQAYRMSRGRIEEIVREHGVTLAQFSILMTLTNEPRLSGIEVAARAFITPQAAHAALTTLERKGLVEREAETAHRRMMRTELSDEGARVVSKCLDELRVLGNELGSGLAASKRRALVSLLREYVAAIDSKS